MAAGRGCWGWITTFASGKSINVLLLTDFVVLNGPNSRAGGNVW